jgi:hypothetical protein
MTTSVRGIAGLDRLAEELATACALRLGVADSPAELIAAHRLRYRDASEHGTTTEADDRDGLARDAFDARSLQICAWDGDTLVGTLRLALPMPGKRLPVEEEFDLSVAPEGEVVDVGPAVVTGGRAQLIADGLLAQAWFEARARGYLVMAGVASSRLVGHYRALGLAVEELGRAEADRNAVRLDPSLS